MKGHLVFYINEPPPGPELDKLKAAFNDKSNFIQCGEGLRGMERINFYPIDDIYQISNLENWIDIQARDDGKVEITVYESTEGDRRSDESSMTLTIDQTQRLADSLIRATEKAKYLATERFGLEGTWECTCIASGETFYVRCPDEMRSYLDSGLFHVKSVAGVDNGDE